MTEQYPPAGWHPDPQDASRLRYWDGTAWTEHVSPQAQAGWPAAGPANPAYPAAPYPAGGYAQSPSNTLSIIGIVCGAVAFVFCPILFGPAGLVLGGIGRSKGERLATVALVVSGLGLVVGIILGVVVYQSLGR
ncbi:MAG TPA: DUF2510 domain-containing protein [Nocardioidaceae bacterium]|nr:DUF2510 domain-containing protein [Nocardioidaceae bacterium]